MTDETIAPEERTGLSTFSKVAIGCALAVAALLMLVFGAVAFALWWTLSPGEQFETRRLAGEETVFVAHGGDLLEDQRVRELLDTAWNAFQEVARQERQDDMPDGLRWLDDFNSNAQPSGSESIEIYAPSEATLVLEPRADGKGLALVAAVNFKNFVRPVRFAVEQFVADEPDVVTHDVEGYTIFEVDPEDFYVGFVAGTLVLGQELEALERAIRRLDVPDEAAFAPLAERVEADRGRWVVSAAGGPGDLRAVLEGLLDRDLDEPDSFGEWERLVPNRFETLRAGIQPRSADRVDLWLEVRCADAEDLARALREALEDLAAEVDVEELELVSEVGVDGERVEATLSILGIEAALDAWVDEHR